MTKSSYTWPALGKACLCCCCVMTLMVLTTRMIAPSFVGHSSARYLVVAGHSKSEIKASELQHRYATANDSTIHSSIKVFVGVLSRATNFKDRQVVRKSWAKDPALARVVFFVMRPNDTDVFYRVRQEAVAMGDIYVLSDVMEHYDRMTYSTLALFKAAALNPNDYTHVVKTDDDIYLRPSLLLHALEGMPREQLYAGYPMLPGSALRGGGWHSVSYDHWADDTRVRYGFGMGYVLSIDLAQEVAAGVAHVLMPPDNLLKIEDLAVGYWVDYVARERKISVNFNSLTMGGQDCEDDFIFFHVTSKPQWNVIECMHEHGGHCCP